jgi:inosine/xanthosine triphosphatase
VTQPVLPPFEPDGKLKFLDEEPLETPDENSSSGVNLALLTLPDDSPLATASAAERAAALAPNPKPITRILIASKNPVKIAAVEAAFRETSSMSANFAFESVNGPSGVSNQPKTQAETRQGAENRARGIFEVFTDTAYSVGIEGGIEDTPQGMASFAWVCIFDGKQVAFAQTAVFYLPDQVAKLVREGNELGKADDIVFGRVNSKQANGAIGLLTHDAITRVEYYTQAVIMALIPFQNEGLTWTSQATPDTPTQQNTVAAFLDALNLAEKTEASTAHTLEHQKHLRDLLAASKMIARVFPQIEGVPPVDQSETKDKLIQSLRRDIELQGSMIQIKNNQVAQLTNDLRKVQEQLEGQEDAQDLKQQRDRALSERDGYRGALARMVLERNDARDLADELASLALQSTSLKTQGFVVSKHLANPTDAQIGFMRNEGWQVVYENYAPANETTRQSVHYMRFERIDPISEPADDEDDAKTAAAAPVPAPVPEPVISHDIIIANPAPALVVENVTITQRLLDGEPLDDIKAKMNAQAVQAGTTAAVANLRANGWLTEEGVAPEPDTVLIGEYDDSRDPLDYEDGPDLF